MNVGVLALQGAVAPHGPKLEALGARWTAVRLPADLEGLDGLILPGGESTTLLNLIHNYGLWQPLLDFGRTRPVWGICAGAILMAATVENPQQQSLGLVQATLRRNAYGRQNESFITSLALTLPGQPPQPIEGVFIRAPQIIATSPGVAVLAHHQGQPVAIQDGLHLATAFHPELSPELALHRHFLSLCQAALHQKGAGLATA